MIGVFLILSLSVERPTPELHYRAVIVALGTLILSALAYAKEKQAEKNKS
jgi:hypothetical protein